MLNTYAGTQRCFFGYSTKTTSLLTSLFDGVKRAVIFFTIEYTVPTAGTLINTLSIIDTKNDFPAFSIEEPINAKLNIVKINNPKV